MWLVSVLNGICLDIKNYISQWQIALFIVVIKKKMIRELLEKAPKFLHKFFINHTNKWMP